MESARRAYLQLQQSQAATGFVVGAFAVPSSSSASSSRFAMAYASRSNQVTPHHSIFRAASTVARGVFICESSFAVGGTTWSTSILSTHRVT